MVHQDRGHYAKKHPGTQLNQALTPLILQASNEGILSCASAHHLAKEQNCLPKEIGIQADLLELRIAQCQLGLFGYDRGKKGFDLTVDITPELKNKILDTHADGKIDCKTCWEIATEFKISKIDMGSVCERLEIRIKSCQLGVF